MAADSCDAGPKHSSSVLLALSCKCLVPHPMQMSAIQLSRQETTAWMSPAEPSTRVTLHVVSKQTLTYFITPENDRDVLCILNKYMRSLWDAEQQCSVIRLGLATQLTALPLTLNRHSVRQRGCTDARVSKVANRYVKTNASAGLQDANPTIRPYATPPPPIPTALPSLTAKFFPRRNLYRSLS